MARHFGQGLYHLAVFGIGHRRHPKMQTDRRREKMEPKRLAQWRKKMPEKLRGIVRRNGQCQGIPLLFSAECCLKRRQPVTADSVKKLEGHRRRSETVFSRFTSGQNRKSYLFQILYR